MRLLSTLFLLFVVTGTTLQAQSSDPLEGGFSQDPMGLIMSQPVPDQVEPDNGPLSIRPIQHGTVVLEWNGNIIYVDPYGGAESFEGIDAPDLVLITDIHGDHLNMETLEGLDTRSDITFDASGNMSQNGGSIFVVPQAVADELPASYQDRLVVIGNGERTEQMGIQIRAIPMYNLPETEDSRHPKGRGNGYVLTMGGTNVYLSGDTEDIPEMRALEDIDIAFVCMNLPFTMDVNQAADAVLDFEPRIVYPYHYRGQNTEIFQELVEAQSDNIEVRLRNWYPE